jgi:hypothetical protein
MLKKQKRYVMNKIEEELSNLTYLIGILEKEKGDKELISKLKFQRDEILESLRI